MILSFPSDPIADTHVNGANHRLLISPEPDEASCAEELLDPALLLSSTSTKTVLIVDDDELICEALAELLESENLGVIVASSGERGLAKLEEYKEVIDLVLLDMQMPGMSGLETLKAIRERYPELKVLLSSGYREEMIGGSLCDDDHAEFVEKPYQFMDLLDKIDAMTALEGLAAP